MPRPYEDPPDDMEQAMLAEDFELFVDLFKFMTDEENESPSDEKDGTLLERFQASDYDSAKRLRL